MIGRIAGDAETVWSQADTLAAVSVLIIIYSV